MEAPRNPHELLAAHAADRCGRIADGVSQFAEGLFNKVLLGVTEQLGIYCDCVAGARLRLGDVVLRDGDHRTFIFAALTDRGGPLRLRDAMATWTAPGDIPVDFVFHVNAYRWRFIDRYLSRLMEPLMRGIHDRLGTFYAAHPRARFTYDLIRFLEGVDRSYLCIEFNLDEDIGKRTDAGRYRIQ